MRWLYRVSRKQSTACYPLRKTRPGYINRLKMRFALFYFPDHAGKLTLKESFSQNTDPSIKK